ncbi:MAG: serine/threonine-protein kinase [Kofleriaceae bacterium]
MVAGSKLGRYELLARIATGGMGEIFLARLEGAAGFEKLCVIKRILPHLADDERFRAMLISEARIASNMSHANICHIYELDETDRQLYLVMEYLEGVTLLQLLRTLSRTDARLDLGFIAGVVQQACEGLHYAHELRDRNGTSLGVVHRDVTPSNLFLTESGVVKIVDFGIAKAKDTQETNSGTVKGKYAYMAPEQLRGQPIDRRVDVFSLGVVVFEMLTCRRLYQRKTDYLTFRAVMEQPVVDVRLHRPDAPEGITAVLTRALDRDPDRRYATARQLGHALQDAFGSLRPWGQGDISELVRTTFAEEIQLNNAEISNVVRRSEIGPPQTIPIILRRTDPDESDYVSIETDVGDEPLPSSDPGSFHQSSDVRSAAFGQAIRVGPQPTQPLGLPQVASHPIAPRRRVLPFVAVIGGAALVLALGLTVVGRAPRTAAARPAGAAIADRSARVDRMRRSDNEPYGAAIRLHERELDQCARDHGEPLPPGAKAVIVVGIDGRATQIALLPDGADRSTLGSCLRGVLHAVTFPAAPEVKELALGLAVYR